MRQPSWRFTALIVMVVAVCDSYIVTGTHFLTHSRSQEHATDFLVGDIGNQSFPHLSNSSGKPDCCKSQAVEIGEETSLISVVNSRTAGVDVLLLIPGRQTGYVYIPVMLTAAIAEFDTETRQEAVTEEAAVHSGLMPDLNQSIVHIHFEVC